MSEQDEDLKNLERTIRLLSSSMKGTRINEAGKVIDTDDLVDSLERIWEEVTENRR